MPCCLCMYIHNSHFLLLNQSLDHYIMPFFISVSGFVLVYFGWYWNGHTSFFISVTWNIIYPSTFRSVCLLVRCVSGSQQLDGILGFNPFNQSVCFWLESLDHLHSRWLLKGSNLALQFFFSIISLFAFSLVSACTKRFSVFALFHYGDHHFLFLSAAHP